VPKAVLTLVAAEGARGRLGPVLSALAAALERLGADLGETHWLAPETACDIAFAGLSADQADAAARRVLSTEFGQLPVDLAVQPAEGRRKRLLVADMESTIIENEMLDELAAFLGFEAEVSEITRRAMNGEIDFTAALTARVALLKGMPQRRLEEAASRIRLTPGAAALVATMRAGGATTALVSGGFRYFTRRIREMLGFDCDIANELSLAGDCLAGTVEEPVVTREVKLATLRRLAAERELPLSATLAVGDGANDVPMLEAAGLGVAFRAKPAVAARIRVRIDHCDLAALLYMQGYRAEEIIRP